MASSFESANKESKSKIRELNLLLKSVNEPGKKSIDLAQNILLVEMLKMSNDSFEPLAIVERKYDIVKTDKRIMICAVLIALIVFTVIMTTLFVNYIDNIKRNEEMTNKFKAAWGKK